MDGSESHFTEKESHEVAPHCRPKSTHGAPAPENERRLVQALLLCRVKARTGSQWLGCHGLREAGTIRLDTHLVGLDGAVGRGVGHAGQDEALLLLVVVEERLVGLVDGALLRTETQMWVWGCGGLVSETEA